MVNLSLPTLEEYETHLSTFELKFPRRFGAERLRLPPMRILFEQYIMENDGFAPTPQVYAALIWDACEDISMELKDDVEARARRAHPTFCREIHLLILLREAFGESADVLYSLELDLKNKTDFLIRSPVEPISIRLHTHTNTRRGNHYAKKERKTSNKNLSNELGKGAAGLPPSSEEETEVDYTLTLDHTSCHNLKNGFWLYSDEHIAKVVELFDNLHSSQA